MKQDERDAGGRSSPPETRQRLVPTSYVTEVLGLAESRGLPVTTLLVAAGLQGLPRDGLTAEQFGEFWRVFGEALDDELLGFGIRRLPVGGIGFLCQSILHARDLKDALSRSLEFLRLVVERPRGELRIVGDKAEIVLVESGPPLSLMRYHLFWMLIGSITGWLVGRRILLARAEFRCARPEADDLSLRMRTSARFDRPLTLFAFDQTYLRLPSVRNEGGLRRFLRHAPARFLIRHWEDHGLAAAIRARLTGAPPIDWPSFDELAAELRVPASSLRRQLRSEGHSYQAIKDDIRRDLALHSLATGPESMNEIAGALGFLEPSAFFRAFRKWTGQTPSVFRNAPDQSTLRA